MPRTPMHKPCRCGLVSGLQTRWAFPQPNGSQGGMSREKLKLDGKNGFNSLAKTCLELVR